MKTLKEFNPRDILKEQDKSQVKVFKDSLSVNLILIYKDVRFLIFDNGQVFYDGINYAEQQYEIEDSAFWGENGIENGFKFTTEEGIELIKRFKDQEIENYSEKMSFEEFYKMEGVFYYNIYKTKEKLSIVVVEDDEEVLECSLYSGSKDISILKDFRKLTL